MWKKSGKALFQGSSVWLLRSTSTYSPLSSPLIPPILLDLADYVNHVNGSQISDFQKLPPKGRPGAGSEERRRIHPLYLCSCLSPCKLLCSTATGLSSQPSVHNSLSFQVQINTVSLYHVRPGIIISLAILLALIIALFLYYPHCAYTFPNRPTVRALLEILE